jgi:hypothetical protein
MAKKIEARDAKSAYDKGQRDSGRKKPKAANIAESGEVRRLGAPSAMQLAASAALDAGPETNRASRALDGLMSDQDRHEQRKGWFLTEAHRQSLNRARMAKCESFYDSEQWAYDKAEELRGRGQPVVTVNEVKPAIDWLLGTERRMRVDFTVVPDLSHQDDSYEAAEDDAQVKTKLLKYLDDTNKSTFERSWASEDQLKAGIGWIEVALRGDRTGVPIYVGCESWRNILWDSQAQKRDLSDARYLFRIKVVDLDVALACFPDKAAQIERCVQTGDQLTVFSEWMGGMGASIQGLDAFAGLEDPLDYVTNKPVDLFNSRKRVLLLECWSREPVQRRPAVIGLADPVQFRIRLSIMTEHDTLLEGWSPYRHDRLPFIPIWGYRNRRTGLPYSPIWPLIGAQELLNTRMSRAAFEAASNQIELEVGAVDETAMDIDQIRAEYNDPNGMPVFAHGALSAGKVRRQTDQQARMTEQLLLADRESTFLRSMSGVNADNRGERSNVTSGRAVLAKQEQGSLLTAELFDNQFFGRALEGEITLSLVEQAMLAPRAFKEPGAPAGEVTRINVPQEDGSYLNDISARRAKFALGEQAWKQTYAEAAFESLFEVLTQLASAAPQVVVNLLDLVFDMHPNLPRKRAVVNRMRQLNKQTDPDGKITPEQQAEQEQAKKVAQQQFELQMAQLIAQVEEARAKGTKLNTEAMANRLKAVRDAAEAASMLASVPELAPITDSLLKSSGFDDQELAAQQAAAAATPAPVGADPMPTQPEPIPQAPTGADTIAAV